MAKIELDVPEDHKTLFDAFCKRTGMTPEKAANNGVDNCVHSEAMEALHRLIRKGVIPAEIVAEVASTGAP